MVNNIKFVLDNLRNIRSVKEKIEYLREFLEVKSADERIKFLGELLKLIKDNELKNAINIMIEEYRLPEEAMPIETGLRAEFLPVEETEEREEIKPKFNLEGLVKKERVEEKEEVQKEYANPPDVFYQSTAIEQTPLLQSIRRELQRKHLIGDAGAISEEQRMQIMKEIEKYSPNLSPERIVDYTNLITGTGFKKYSTERINPFDRDIDKEREGTKYRPMLGVT